MRSAVTADDRISRAAASREVRTRPRRHPTDFLDARTGGGSKGHVAHAGFWENIVVTCEFRGGAAAEIRIHPIEQGFGASLGQRGRPMLASGAIADRVIDRVAELSRIYGVTVRNDNGVGVIRIDAAVPTSTIR
jgi:poly-gamma-glutamate synthesis protein (capsule biosynthesis protein)